MKKIVKYIGGAIKPAQAKWGGTIATNHALLLAMQEHPAYQFTARYRADFSNPEQVAAFLRGAAVTHVDDTLTVARMFVGRLSPPDIIGPITRSPLKNYAGWLAPYPPAWFYRARIIRLNYAEEKLWPEMVTLIRHGVDTQALQPSPKPKKYVVWAGDQKRYAKNWPMAAAIIESTPLPEGYAWKTLSNYRVEDYWRLLEETALLVNTSRYESFCAAAFEAMAKGVPVIWRVNLQGGVHEGAGLRVEYEVEAYRAAIMAMLQGRQYQRWGLEARKYCEQHASLAAMRQDLTAVYDQVGKNDSHI